MILQVLLTIVATALFCANVAAFTQYERDLPPGCNCTGIGCQYGPISDPPQGSIGIYAPNGTNTGNTGGDGYILRVSFTPPPCFPNTMFTLAVLNGNGATLSKVYDSPDLLGPILINLGGTAAGGNASLILQDEPFTEGNYYQATIFTYNTTNGNIGVAVTDLDFSWETPYAQGR